MEFKMSFDDLEVMSKVQELLKFDFKEVGYQSLLEDDSQNYILSVELESMYDILVIKNVLECLDDIAENNSEDIFNYLLEKKKQKYSGNPFHDKAGHFTGKKGLKDGGSRSIKGKRKQQITGVKGEYVQYKLTYNTGWGDNSPCGRDARYSKTTKGGDVRCHLGEIKPKTIKKLKKAIAKKQAKKKVKSSGGKSGGSKSSSKKGSSKKSGSSRSGGSGGGGGTFSQAAKMVGLEK